MKFLVAEIQIRFSDIALLVFHTSDLTGQVWFLCDGQGYFITPNHT